ncbi:addiction module antidote protein [Caulobacter sp. NIBR2454]|uniref:addiction module antidote protein n=1 Tax=Caulobacter sp. NIBR2454 TaxID=3015996 RepID=UPI0022B6192E|nr:addiction module antidote protein [Caulobacter sp. NIBR2454]
MTATTPFNAADHIETPEQAAVFLDEALATGDAGYIQHALGVLARSKGMTHLADATGLGRQGLYKALAEDGSPKFETVLNVVRALGIQLHATLADQAAA